MGASRLVQLHDLVVALDYGQFYLRSSDDDHADDAVRLAELALDGDGMAQASDLLVLISPHQNNFAMQFTVELWDGVPADDLAEWQEAFEAHVEISQFGLLYESPTMDMVDLEVPPGSYRLQVVGRGFVAEGWPGSSEPGDVWRARLWPSHERTPARRLRRWSPETSVGEDGAVTPTTEPLARRVYDVSDPTRVELLQRIEDLAPTFGSDYSGVELDPADWQILSPQIIEQVVPSQIRLVLEGPDIDSIDPHEYLRARAIEHRRPQTATHR